MENSLRSGGPGVPCALAMARDVELFLTSWLCIALPTYIWSHAVSRLEHSFCSLSQSLYILKTCLLAHEKLLFSSEIAQTPEKLQLLSGLNDASLLSLMFFIHQTGPFLHLTENKHPMEGASESQQTGQKKVYESYSAHHASSLQISPKHVRVGWMALRTYFGKGYPGKLALRWCSGLEIISHILVSMYLLALQVVKWKEINVSQRKKLLGIKQYRKNKNKYIQS